MNAATPTTDGINLVLKFQLTAITDLLKKPKNQIDVEVLRGLLEAARDTLGRAEKLKIEISNESMALLPAGLRAHFIDKFLQYTFASFPR